MIVNLLRLKPLVTVVVERGRGFRCIRSICYTRRTQDLNCLLLHESNCRFRVGEPLINALFLGILVA